MHLLSVDVQDVIHIGNNIANSAVECMSALAVYVALRLASITAFRSCTPQTVTLTDSYGRRATIVVPGHEGATERPMYSARYTTPMYNLHCSLEYEPSVPSAEVSVCMMILHASMNLCMYVFI